MHFESAYESFIQIYGQTTLLCFWECPQTFSRKCRYLSRTSYAPATSPALRWVRGYHTREYSSSPRGRRKMLFKWLTANDYIRAWGKIVGNVIITHHREGTFLPRRGCSAGWRNCNSNSINGIAPLPGTMRWMGIEEIDTGYWSCGGLSSV